MELENLLFQLNGQRVLKIDGVIFPQYLYSFKNGLWLSYELDKKGRYVNVCLGRLFLFDDDMPRIMVLEPLDVYYYFDMYKLLGENENNHYILQPEENMLDLKCLKEYIQIILDYYSTIIKNKKVEKKITKMEKKLKPFLLKDLSNCVSLEDELFVIKQTFQGKINKENSNKVIKKASKKSHAVDAFLEICIELGVIVVGILVAKLIFKDISNLSEELIYIFGIGVLFIVLFVIFGIRFLIKKRKKI